MLTGSQPLDSEKCKKQNFEDDFEWDKKFVVVSQRIGNMLDDHPRKANIFRHIAWQLQRIQYAYYDMKRTIRNCFVWFKVMPKLRQWEGGDGIICVIIAHLRDYIKCEEKYGTSVKEDRDRKIATAKETIKILRRIRDHDAYYDRRRYQVMKRYPKYKTLISKYENGCSGYGGDFIAQGNAWVCDDGYFEFVDGRLEEAVSPDINETERLIAEIKKYNEEIQNAHKQAEIDSEKDFDRLAKLLKENLYSWWD